MPTGNPNDDDLPNPQQQDDEEVKKFNLIEIEFLSFLFKKDDEDRDENNDEEGEDDGDECHGNVRSRRSRPSGGSMERTSGGSGADEECLDTDENDTIGFDDENNTINPNSTERTKVVSEEDVDFIKALDALVAESVAVSFLFIFH